MMVRGNFNLSHIKTQSVKEKVDKSGEIGDSNFTFSKKCPYSKIVLLNLDLKVLFSKFSMPQINSTFYHSFHINARFHGRNVVSRQSPMSLVLSCH